MITYNDTDLILAPCAGYTDAGMRTLCTRYGAGLCFTEMVSAKGLLYNNANTEALLTLLPEEKNTGVQLFGSEPDILAAAIQDERLKKFPVIDINMGCPVPKIVTNGEGSALMKDPDRIFRIVKAAKEAAGDRLLTVKMRAGFYSGYENAPECAAASEEAGADMVTVHGRTRDMYYSGKVDYGIIGKVKQAVKIPVCGNGDVTDRDSYLKMKETTGVDYVSIARGAFGRPYVFAAIRDEEYDFNVKQAVLEHISLLSFLPERTVANCMKKQIAFYIKGRRGHKEIKETVFRASDMKELISVIDLIDF